MAKRKDILLLDRPRDAVFSELVAVVYDAALDMVAWPEILEHLVPHLDGKACILVWHDHREKTSRIQYDFGLEPGFRVAYNEIGGADDPWLPRLRFPARAGWVCTGEDIIVEPEMMASPFYRRWLAPQGLLHALFGIVSCDEDNALVAVVLRREDAAPFGAGDAERFRQILPHMRRGMSIQRSLNRESLERNALLGALDHLPIGVVIVNEDCEILTINRAATEMCGPDGGLTNTHNRLGAASSTDAARLRKSVAIALNGRSAKHGKSGKSLSVHRATGEMPLAALVIPVQIKIGDMGEDRRAAAVFIADPSRDIEVDQGWLKDLFELTEAEARVASLLVRGYRLDEAAEHLGVSLNTVRTHLKRIFSKTGTRRQAELMRLVLTGMTQIYVE